MPSDSYSNILIHFLTSNKKLIRSGLISELITSLLFSKLTLISWMAETTFPLSLHNLHYESLMLYTQRHSIFPFNLVDYCSSLKPEMVYLSRGKGTSMT